MAVHSGDRAHWEKIAFITALCERHQPNYALYCETIGEPEKADQLRKVLNKVWEYLAGQLKSMKNLEKALLQLEEITPEPTEDDGYGVYPALDCCLLLTSALQMILDDSADDLEAAEGLSLATVSHFIAFAEDLEEFDPSQQQHELYDQEQELQQWLKTCLTSPESQSDIIKQLRKRLNEFESSNLGIAI
ncbi:DUF416 family protein [Pseudomaricurvus sp.]|uniref:DUF416 family protein n=1 Tax=Pseudomaricurvus sp. TaxID=2004510 RepID=UPI003F6A9BA1